jgi:hypothetical protein
MKRIYAAALLFLVASPNGYADEGGDRSINVVIEGGVLRFHCDGVVGSSRVTVDSSKSITSHPILTKQLDEVDDCSQAVWDEIKMGSASTSTLVMLNPGRFGLNAQFSTFLVKDGTVNFSGYVPVNAEKVNEADFRSNVSEGGSIWEQMYSLVGRKIVFGEALRLMQLGVVCVSSSGDILAKDPCPAKRISASMKSPICIKYRKTVGRIVPLSECSSLKNQ